MIFYRELTIDDLKDVSLPADLPQEETQFVVKMVKGKDGKVTAKIYARKKDGTWPDMDTETQPVES